MTHERSTGSFPRRTFLQGAVAGAAVLAAQGVFRPAFAVAATGEEAVFKLPSLPYPEDTLEPFVSARTLSFHYGKHHQGYVNNLNNLVKGKAFERMSLEEVIVKTAGDSGQASVFNNAAQVWNHTFYWNSMQKDGGGPPQGPVAAKISEAFGSYENFRKEFAKAAATVFGSGWAWLVLENGKLKITQTSNADTPAAHGQKAVLTIDVWEHAYYLDYQNQRVDYIQAFLDHLLNWDFVAQNLE